ncbi:NADPH-dependent FMN reductase [Tessaracoccus antarcticus]|uniref:NADPH-dependent oxidoreductase n=1 Tax=Tessaracoccus antarcticus TaxID=2479848 RepID=A0A3M0G6D7_9ACTN|nr:NAD(P)H-dependent oxidoreductase [Tessaracoccus antarcticus]RMB57872.1 NADPH-dependent oxidoreductase [Tessaracoccus antarcticus]
MTGTGGAGLSVDVRVLVLSGSARTGSLNTQLARLAAEVMVDLGATTEVLTISEFETPGYSQDVEDSTGFPPGAQRFKEALLAVDAFLLVSPEYNFSMPGVVKNIIDWVSRFRPQPFQQKHALLMSASGSMAGGNRGLWALRIPLEHLGVRVFPDMFSLAQAHRAFSENGELIDDQLENLLRSTVAGFLDLVEASKHYPCLKRDWVEYLGEPFDDRSGAVNRVDAASVGTGVKRVMSSPGSGR